MKPTENNWPTTKGARNVQFLAQLLREMLDRESFESFRVQTLDLTSRIFETKFLALQVKQKRLKPVSLAPALEELLWSLRNDLDANEFAGPTIKRYVASTSPLSAKSPADLEKIIQYTSILEDRIIAEYRRHLEMSFKEIFSSNDPRSHTLRVAQALVAYLINAGFDRRYILSVVNERFFSADVHRVETRTLSRFLSKFHHSRRDFHVYIPIRKSGHNFLAKLDLPFMEGRTFKQLPKQAQQILSAHKAYDAKDRYAFVKVRRNDPFSAHENAADLIESLSSLTLMQRESFDFQWSEYAFVVLANGSKGQLITRENFAFQKASDSFHGARARSLKKQTFSILENFDSASMDRAIRAAGTVSLARPSSNIENQLVLLWSAIEVLLSDPPEGEARISHYLDSIVPCVCLNYPRRYLCALYDELAKYHRTSLLNHLRKMDMGDLDQHTRFAHFVFDDKYKSLQDSFSKEISANSLALFRIWKLHNNFSNPDRFLASVTAHDDRVRWQVARIYRTRNEIVHAGLRSLFIEPLVQNTFEYFKTAFGTIVGRAENFDGEADIDNLVHGIGFDYDIFVSQIRDLKKGSNSFTSEDISLFFGKR